MTDQQAKTILDYLCQDAASEVGTTSRVLAAMPGGKDEYTPDGKSMKAIDLAWHIASADVWFMDSIAKGSFDSGDSKRPEELKTGADISRWYEPAMKAAIARVQSLAPEKAGAVLDFFGAMKAPAYVFASLAVKHSVHHRGQLSAYLRPMGGKVPSIYGGSADEPMTH